MKRKIIYPLLAVILLVMAGACWFIFEGRTSDTAGVLPDGKDILAGTERKVLVAYFTLGENANQPEGVQASSSASVAFWNGELTGSAGIIARIIHEKTGGKVFPILTEQKYPASYSAAVSAGLAEKAKNARPALNTHVDDMAEYNTVFIVYPAWWYKMPMAVYTFLDEYDLSGKVIYMCVVSSSSGFTGEISQVMKMEPEAQVVRGISVNGEKVFESRAKIEEWFVGVMSNW